MRHLPNLITLLRILLVLPVIYLIRLERYDVALIVAAVAGASDALDGYLAKRYGWQSWLGGILDPLADKLLLLGCFVSLGLGGQIPVALVALVIGRDVVIVAGAVFYHNLIGPLTAQPTRLSKLTTAVQIVYVLIVLLHLSGLALSALLPSSLAWLVAASTLASGLHYVGIWSAKARRELAARHSRNP